MRLLGPFGAIDSSLAPKPNLHAYFHGNVVDNLTVICMNNISVV